MGNRTIIVAILLLYRQIDHFGEEFWYDFSLSKSPFSPQKQM